MTCSLVIQNAFLGDVVLATPLITRLAADGPVDVVTTPQAAPLLANHPSIRRVVAWDKRGVHRGLRGLRRMASEVHSRDRADTAYCAQGSVRSALLARLAGYVRRIGFETSAGSWLYTNRARYDRDQHHAERLLRLALGPDAAVTREAIRPSLHPGHPERAAVDTLLASARDRNLPMVVLAPGSIWATKRWPGFPELAVALSERAQVVVTGGPEDRDLAAGILAATSGRALDATGRLSLLGSAELIRRAALLVTNDSAPQHLASAVGTRTLTIFGPTVEQFGFGPLAAGSATVANDSLDCRPCDSHGPARCPLGHFRCMRDLDPGRVTARARRLLEDKHA